MNIVYIKLKSSVEQYFINIQVPSNVKLIVESQICTTKLEDDSVAAYQRSALTGVSVSLCF